MEDGSKGSFKSLSIQKIATRSCNFAPFRSHRSSKSKDVKAPRHWMHVGHVGHVASVPGRHLGREGISFQPREGSETPEITGQVSL